MLLDNPELPRALLLLEGGMLYALGDADCFEPMFNDLLHGQVEALDQWPPRHMLSALSRQFEKEQNCSLFLNTVPVSAHAAALAAGWLANQDDKGSPPAYLFVFSGEPRFSELVVHDCRLGQGTELLELLKQGISYDEEGYYIRLCLQNGPSFVCEVDGEPVCWSCTHLNGTMGMIYTPDQHRRRGFARSLAAFQIDYMLAQEGIACCHVVEGNIASEQMVLGMGARRAETAYCWRSVLWPQDCIPAEVRTGK